MQTEGHTGPSMIYKFGFLGKMGKGIFLANPDTLQY
jgi:hypothetical protein